LTEIQKHSQFQVGGGSYFDIQYDGHRGQIFGGPISENMCTILMNIYAKFGAFNMKCTIGQLSSPTTATWKRKKKK